MYICLLPIYFRNFAQTPGATDAYAVSLIVASAFLLVTILVYILLWEKQNVHGFTSLAYFASMFGMYIFTALRRLDYLMFFQNEMGYGCFAIGNSLNTLN